MAKLTGDDWGYGWNAGILYELNPDNRFSLTYRSKVTVKFKDGKYSNDLQVITLTLMALVLSALMVKKSKVSLT